MATEVTDQFSNTVNAALTVDSNAPFSAAVADGGVTEVDLPARAPYQLGVFSVTGVSTLAVQAYLKALRSFTVTGSTALAITSFVLKKRTFSLNGASALSLVAAKVARRVAALTGQTSVSPEVLTLALRAATIAGATAVVGAGEIYTPPAPGLSLDFTSGTYTDGTNTALADITTFTRTSTAWYMDASGAIQSASTGVARDAHHEYDGASWNRKLLLETDAATNVNTSFTPDTNYAPIGGAAVSFNNADSPVGTGTAALWTENTSNGVHTWRTNLVTVTSTNRHTWSWLMKSNGRDHWIVTAGSSRVAGTISGNSNWSVAIDLSAGTAVEALGRTECGIEDFGGGWYRVWMAFVPASVGVVPILFGARAVAGGSSVYTGDGTSGFWLDAGQVTEGDFPFMFIPTSGSSVTRAAETLSVNAASVPWSTTAMSFVFKGAASWMDSESTEEAILFGSYVDASNTIDLSISGAGADTGKLLATVENGGTVETADGPSNTAAGYRKPISAGLRYTTSDLRAADSGTAGTNQTGVGGSIYDYATNSKTLTIGGDGNAYTFNGTIDLIEMWDSDVGASQLETETA